MKQENEENTSLLKNLFGNSAVIGLSQIFSTRSIIRKFIWAAVLITGLIFCALESNKFMVEFRKYPVTITLAIENRGMLPFPAITVCNLNKVRKSQRHIVLPPRDNQTFHIVDQFPKEEPSFSPVNESLNETDQVVVRSFPNFKPKINQDEFEHRYRALNKSMRGDVGHQYNNFVQKATFNSDSVNGSDFNRVVKGTYGACYTFNDQLSSNGSLRTARTIGISSGLSLELNLELEEYLETTTSVGARIIIHSPYEYPDVEGNGINILPGVETSIAMKKNTYKRLPFPYKDKCVDYKTEKTFIHNRQDCMVYCLQQRNAMRCNCTDSSYIFTKSASKCDKTNNSVVACLESVYQEIVDDHMSCNCQISCISTEYHTTISMASWPSPKSLPSYSSDFQHNHSTYKSTYAKVGIYYSTLEETIYLQQPAYQDSEWYSHMGGQLGLWLGISLPAMFDCAETIIFLIYHFVRRCCKKDPTKSNTLKPKSKKINICNLAKLF